MSDGIEDKKNDLYAVASAIVKFIEKSEANEVNSERNDLVENSK